MQVGGCRSAAWEHEAFQRCQFGVHRVDFLLKPVHLSIHNAERRVLWILLLGRTQVGNAALKYINRLSDHLFVLSRYVNDKGALDVLWVPGANR